MSYNEHGFKSEVQTTVGNNCLYPVGVAHKLQDDGALIPAEPTSNAPPEPTPFLKGLKYLNTYEYRNYDEHGNWTEQTETMRMGTGEIGPESIVRNLRRSFAYW